MSKITNLAIIGCGGMARHHIRNILKQTNTTKIVALCEPNPDMLKAAGDIFSERELPTPPNRPELDDLLNEFGTHLDAAFIVTPHNCHYDQTVACMKAGLDVLLEKPMVMNAVEAQNLIDETASL